MQVKYRIKIDLVALREALVMSEQRRFTNDDLVEWLIKQGFRLTRGAFWTSNAKKIERLPRQAIVFSEPLSN